MPHQCPCTQLRQIAPMGAKKIFSQTAIPPMPLSSYKSRRPRTGGLQGFAGPFP
jgi:hypothetical protein